MSVPKSPGAPLFEKDIRMLFKAMEQRESTKYSDFLDAWKSFRFMFIHYACDKNQDRKKFMLQLYSIVLEYFSKGNWSVQITALYMLYALYYSQISKTVMSRVPIPIPFAVWTHMATLYDELQRLQHADGLYVFHKLLDDDILQFVISPRSNMMAQNGQKWIKKVQNFKNSFIIDQDTYKLPNEMKDLASSYELSKISLLAYGDSALENVVEHIDENLFEMLHDFVGIPSSNKFGVVANALQIASPGDLFPKEQPELMIVQEDDNIQALIKQKERKKRNASKAS